MSTKKGEPSIQIRCNGTLIPLEEIAKLRNPKNRNDHPPEQIAELAEQFKYQGIRHPIIVSNRSKRMVAGDGRFQAAQALGMSEYPVDNQDFDSDEQEYAFGIADNALQQWSLLNFKAINMDLGDLGPDFDIERLGIKNFTLEPFENLPEAPPAQRETQGGDTGLATKIILYFEEEQYFKVMASAQRLIEREGYTDLSSMFSDLLFKAAP